MCNIFKTASAMTLVKTILENPDKVNEKRFVFERLAQFSKAV